MSILTFILHHSWILVMIWFLTYLSDYYLTILSSKLYQAYLKDHILFEGSLELTPVFQQDVDKLRLVSSAFLVRLFLSSLLLLLIWFLAVIYLGIPQLFYFGFGAIFLREVPVHLRHIRNLGLFYYSKLEGGLQGRLEYARWLTLKLSAVEIASFALLFAAFSILLESWFFFGGAVACLMLSVQHWAWGRKLLKKTKVGIVGDQR